MPTPTLPCPHCQFSRRSVCKACRGTGRVRAALPLRLLDLHDGYARRVYQETMRNLIADSSRRRIIEQKGGVVLAAIRHPDVQLLYVRRGPLKRFAAVVPNSTNARYHMVYDDGSHEYVPSPSIALNRFAAQFGYQ